MSSTTPRPNNGGKRRHHVPPSLTFAQLDTLSELRSMGERMKNIERSLGVSRSTIYRAVKRLGAYA